jgi:hypothetical protein
MEPGVVEFGSDTKCLEGLCLFARLGQAMIRRAWPLPRVQERAGSGFGRCCGLTQVNPDAPRPIAAPGPYFAPLAAAPRA